MISLTRTLPTLSKKNAELVKIYCLWEAYKDDNNVLFWTQDGDKALISMTDGNMIIYNRDADLVELEEFVSVLNPVAIYSDYDTLCGIGRKPKEKINIMCRFCDIKGDTAGDELKSDELYGLLDVDGLSLPEYPHFAVDFCRRKNKGFADYFALKGKCAIITFNTGNYAIINGLASREKGFGSVALKSAISKNNGRNLLVCCRDKVKGFYLKNGFEQLYFGGYWIRNEG